LSILDSACLREDSKEVEFKDSVNRMSHFKKSLKESYSSAFSSIINFWYETDFFRWIAHMKSYFKTYDSYVFTKNSYLCSGSALDVHSPSSGIHLYPARGFAPDQELTERSDFKTLKISDEFYGYGFGPIETINNLNFRRLDFGHNEGYISLKVPQNKNYRFEVKIHNETIKWTPNLKVSVNGVPVKQLFIPPRKSGDALASFIFLVPAEVVSECNGRIEILFSTNGNSSRPSKNIFDPWTGWSFLVNSINFSTTKIY
jgi:hypothetical protein